MWSMHIKANEKQGASEDPDPMRGQAAPNSHPNPNSSYHDFQRTSVSIMQENENGQLMQKHIEGSGSGY